MNTHTLAMAVQSETSTSLLSPPSPPPPSKKPPPLPPPSKSTSDRDFLRHVEAYLAKRDGVDKLLKISRYTSKLLLASHALPSDSPLTRRLSSFESSVGLSRKAFRLGKFIQDVNALRDSHRHRHDHRWVLEIIAYGGEGVYFFVEQLVWLAKSGLIDKSHARALGKVSAWAELVGYVGSVAIKAGELTELAREVRALEAKREVAAARGEDTAEEEQKVRRKMMMKRMSVVQDVADALMAVADVRELSAPLVVAAAGLLSALISTHKNWVSC